ncbi:uncharacterized protein CMU_018690 [Cryptosporidium muris RN66]|uniref:Uncharacterized protein n=1 Tax=Cryptosporidium muris (strain RN66) TaxID=441375 RepID=B6ADA8_CRYMR|nr:uncharacterized protein CMU_018690 [Cryptosporidium muris RN66]EEA06112.1 hypothetical protein, conserved [Cryptosporidium muris RN66]|eukprot:XP_002140461.1 hypothetical protein [Cryptosporidium muris RN66]
MYRFFCILSLVLVFNFWTLSAELIIYTPVISGYTTNITNNSNITLNTTNLTNGYTITPSSFRNFTLEERTPKTKISEGFIAKTTSTTVINDSDSKDPWYLIEEAMNNTNYVSPEPPFTKDSVGACVNKISDTAIIFGVGRDEFQKIIVKCSRKSFGNFKLTKSCLSKVELSGHKLSEGCINCWSATVACGRSNCAHHCFANTCVAKCQKCSLNHCSKDLNKCAGTKWLPFPCGLNPHNPIPDNFKAKEPH